ncbi:MAG: hypothetical protein IJ462_03770 [Clostridia bacterium]|nr:hypothetical protein [Clostridia bacterium]
MTAEYILGNDIFEMEPLSAKSFLAAEADTQKLLMDTHPEYASEVIKWAAIAGASLHKNGKRVFCDTEDVLNTLTVEQILSFSNAYGCLEGSMAGTVIIQGDEKASEDRSSKTQPLYQNRYIYSFPQPSAVFSLEDFSDAVQMESLRRFRRIGGDLFDR